MTIGGVTNLFPLVQQLGALASIDTSVNYSRLTAKQVWQFLGLIQYVLPE